MAKTQTILLVDGNSIMNRAFYGVSDLTNAKGLHTNGIFGFLNMVLNTIKEEAATHLVVAFDLKGPTFRHDLFEAYKGTRKGMPDELREQMPVIKSVLQAMDVTIMEEVGFEADDLLGTLAKQAESEGFQVTIYSGDKDLLQMATEKIKIALPKTNKSGTTTLYYHEADVLGDLGVTPTQFIDVKGLMGDSSDNIPGVPGIGEKTALKWIAQYGSIEGVYDHIEALSAKQAEKMITYEAQAYLSRKLATIMTDCKINISLSACTIGNLFQPKAYALFKELELKSFYHYFEGDTTEGDLVVFKTIEQLTSVDDALRVLNTLTDVYYYAYIEKDFTALGLLHGETILYGDTVTLGQAGLKDLVQAIHQVPGAVFTQDVKKQLHAFDFEGAHMACYDMTLMAYLVNPNGDQYAIDQLVGQFLNQTLKSIEELLGKGKNHLTMQAIELNARMAYMQGCVHYLEPVCTHLMALLEEKNMLTLYETMELPLIYALTAMEKRGVLVDKEALAAYQTMLGDEIAKLETSIYDYAGETFNLNSPKQLGVILFEKLGLPVIKKTKTGYSTAVDVLEKLKDHHPIIMTMMTYRTLAKLKSTYADGLYAYIAKDGKVHTTFSQQTAATGRLSSLDPNLQNIPIRLPVGQAFRKVFIPKPGYVFVDADYSQIELRLLAHLSEDATFIEAFNQNADIHSITAAKVFHVPEDQVTDGLRRQAKAVNFGIVYGISGFGLSQDLNISVAEANKTIQDYFIQYPKVKEFLDATVQKAKEDGFTTTMFNRIRPIPELSSRNFSERSFGERIAMNTPIQGTAADIMKLAIIHVEKVLKDSHWDAQLILTVHDELLVEVLEKDAKDVQQRLIEEMEQVVTLSVPLTVEAHRGNTWLDAK